jgi:hypothetical protein
MSDTGELPPAGEYDLGLGYVPEARETDDPEKAATALIERTARKVGRTLQRALSRDKEARAELSLVAAEILSRTDRLDEWRMLHHLLHEVLVAVGPFRANLELAASGSGLSVAQRQSLLQNWRICQDRMDALANFADGVRWIGRPFRQERSELRGAPWAVDTVGLRLLVEDALKEDPPNTENLREITDEFTDACHRHMALADQHLQDVLDEIKHLFTCLLGYRQTRLSELPGAR